MCGKEVDALIENYNTEYKLRWEQVRWLGYVTAAVYSNKIEKPEDILKFTWEHTNVSKSEEEKKIEKQEQERVKTEMLEWLKSYKKGE